MSSKKSLSFYTNIPAPYQLSFFRALADCFDLTVIYYATQQNGNQWKLDPEANYHTIVLKNNFIAKTVQRVVPDFHFSWTIFKIVSEDKSDFIIVGGGYWIPNSVVALIGSKIQKKKIAYFSEALFPSSSKAAHLLKSFVLKILNLCCNIIFCTGKKAAISFENFGVKPLKYIVPYNIDISAFKQEHIDHEKVEIFKKRYNSENAFLILSSGFLIPRKGMDILIKAVKEIKADFKLLILGGGEQEAELKALCGADERIVFAGFQESVDIPNFFSIANLFVLASRYDGWGVVVNEAIAANLPIISSDKVGAALELITTGVNGVICESGNVQEFKEAIENLIQNQERLNRIKKSSLELMPRISSDYNASQVHDIFINL